MAPTISPTIQCPRCDIGVTPEEVQSGFSPVCPECDQMDPEQSRPDTSEDEPDSPTPRLGDDEQRETR